MNTIQSRYKQHTTDVYGIGTASIPSATREDLAILADEITTLARPLFLKNSLQNLLDNYRRDKKVNAELILFDKKGIINVETEIKYLQPACLRVQDELESKTKQLVCYLELNQIINAAPTESVDFDILRKSLKTAYWLKRNL